MRKIIVYTGILLLTFFQHNLTFGQEVLRDTTLFEEHQVLFEQMDFIPSEKMDVQIYRIYKNDTSILTVNSDPYWIGSLVSNKEYNEYLNEIQKDSSESCFKNAISKPEIQSQLIKLLNITLRKYNTSSVYEFYPVLGLSWIQANQFCKWKTIQVNLELDKVNLPHEKIYRIPLQAEIESAKRFIDINLPRVFKADSTYNNQDLIDFYGKINEWTGEPFDELSYLDQISQEDVSDEMIIYYKSTEMDIPFKNVNSVDLQTGFRYVQTYRNVRNSK